MSLNVKKFTSCCLLNLYQGHNLGRSTTLIAII